VAQLVRTLRLAGPRVQRVERGEAPAPPRR
jgi:hypothetical protein